MSNFSEEYENHELKNCPKQLSDILDGIAKDLSGDDISYIVAQWMNVHNCPIITAKAYHKNTGALMFKMRAESGDDLEDTDIDFGPQNYNPEDDDEY